MPKRPTDKQYLAAAKSYYEKEGDLEFDEKIGTALVSKAPGNPEMGAYVQCWKWIYDGEVRAHINKEKARGKK